jgi:hypothetical protein
LITDVSGNGGAGTVTFYLEHGVQDCTIAAVVPVKLSPAPQRVTVDILLPTVELGCALVAEFRSGDIDAEDAEYFTIANNFQRVALFGANPGGTRDVTLDNDTIRKAV